MEKPDILSTDFYLKKLVCVIKSEMNNSKIINVNGRHSHAFVYILSGSCSYNFNNEYEFTVNTGDILYLAHNAEYAMNVHTPNYRYIYCDFELNDNILRKSNVYTPQNTSDTENQFIKLVKAYNVPSRASFSKCISIIYNIYSMLVAEEDKVFKQVTEEKIIKAKEYIDTNYFKDTLSISFLADDAEISEVYFRKLFKEKYHISPAQYITSTRIKKAKQLLNYRFLSLEECAHKCGFSTVQYFCRVFKKTTGMTPTEYRNQK